MQCKSFINLRISGLGLNLPEITDQLKIAPSHAYKKGDIYYSKKPIVKEIIYQEDCWISGTENQPDDAVEQAIDGFLEKLLPSSIFLKELARKHNVTIWISAYPDSEQANIHLSSQTINALSEIGATLDCSMALLKDFYDGTY
jgi:hypothetical protein